MNDPAKFIKVASCKTCGRPLSSAPAHQHTTKSGKTWSCASPYCEAPFQDEEPSDA